MFEAPSSGLVPLVHQLMRAHQDGVTLSRELLIAQGIADEAESEAAHCFDLAAAHPWDEELAEEAVAAAVASEQAGEHELEAAARWSSHCARTRALIEELRKQLPTPGSPRPQVTNPQNGEILGSPP